MSIALSINVRDAVGPQLAALESGLGGDLSGLHEAIGTRARNLVIDHLTEVAKTKHKTADALGAPPTRHFEDPASYTTASADREAATIGIRKVGMGRALHDVTIRPRAPRKFLAIPAIAAAYGQRAYRIRGLVAIVNGDRGVLMMPQAGKSETYRTRRYRGPDRFTTVEKKGGKFGTVWFVLVRKVEQKQDRSLLPSDAEFQLAAKQGALDFIDYLLARGKAAR
jgi:hypothetical protein